MNILAHFIKPEMLLQLNDAEIRALGAIIDAEITGNAEIKTAISKRLHDLMPKLPRQVANK
ncbi:hypothetical protein [Bradyrhizobium sp. SZCCHNR1051]|uniref:hypothetical protein n=1 Tax=Bradyrhizobium sp. SZCCHNR1051 TaxID=3057355 RepID=UPI0029170E73|nr:hypothetical protein [Bradyrhizobium sp. SZCCHNR1051]